MLIVLTGPASSGKDTVQQRLLQHYPSLNRVVTLTTRLPRRGEHDGDEYNFISREEFEQKVKDGEFLEYVDFSGDLYGTTKDSLLIADKEGEDLIWRVESSRAANLEEVLPQDLLDKTVVIYLNTHSWDVLEDRMRARGTSEDKIKERLKKDKEDLEKYRGKLENIVFNEQGKIDKTMEQVTKLIDAKKGQVPT
ncbi:MAG: guanylate kinase [Patescibacteria group bacterium]